VWTLSRFAWRRIVGTWRILIVGINYIFTLVVDVVHTVVLLCAKLFGVQLFLRLQLSCIAICHLISGRRLPYRTLIDIFALFGVRRFHIRILILPHIQLGGYLLALTYRTILCTRWTLALIARTLLVLSLWSA